MKSVLVQIVCCFLLCIPTFMTAFATVWPSYTITIFKSPQSPLAYNITSDDANLIGSFPTLGSLIGTIFGGFVSESLGRKRTEILCGLLLVLSWSLTTIVKSVPLLLIARVVLGIAGGVHLVTLLVYISEISQRSICGITINLIFFMYGMGTLFSYIVGWFCGYHVICYLNLTLAVSFVALMCLLKDSPGYLIGKGREKEALESLQFYRGVSTANQDVLDELAYIKRQRVTNNAGKSGLVKSPNLEENEKLHSEDEKQEIEEESPWKLLRKSKASQRALITTAIIIILTMLTGISGVLTYAGQLFMLAVPELSSDFCSVVLAVVVTFSGGLAAVVTDMFGRRTLLFFSTITTTLSLLLLGTMLKWQWAPRWAVPCMVLLYCAGFQIGANNIPFVQLAESLMPQVKSLCTSITTCCMFSSSFICLIIFVPLVEHLGLDNTFFIFAMINTIAIVIIYFIVKETKGMKFEEVQDMFEKGYLCRYPIKIYN